jgi:hypothetical protein
MASCWSWSAERQRSGVDREGLASASHISRARHELNHMQLFSRRANVGIQKTAVKSAFANSLRFFAARNCTLRLKCAMAMSVPHGVF